MTTGLLQNTRGGGDTSNLVTLDTAQTITDAKTITPATDVVALKIHPSGSQTVNLLEATSDGTNVRFRLDSAGRIGSRGLVVGAAGIGTSLTYDVTQFGINSIIDSSAVGSYFRLCANSIFGFNGTNDNCNGSQIDTGFARVAAGIIKPVSNQTGSANGCIELGDIADAGAPSANSVRICSESGEFVVTDAANNETILSPHADNAPKSLYSDEPGREKVDRTVNVTDAPGREVRWLNHTRIAVNQAIILEELAALGSSRAQELVAAGKHVAYLEESLDDYVARTGRQKAARTWFEIEQEKQAREDARRAAAIESRRKQEAQHAADLAAAESAHAALTAAYESLPEKEKAALQRPVKEAIPLPELIEPPLARDVRKLPPSWLPKDKQPPMEWMLDVGAAVAAEMEAAVDGK